MKALCAALVVLSWVQACTAQAPQAKQSPPFWTAVEEKEYQDCIPRAIKAWSDPKLHWTQDQIQKTAEDNCLVDEEHKRWLRNHPTAKTEDKAKMKACLHTNAAKINGTKDEFRATFDGCMREAYSLP